MCAGYSAFNPVNKSGSTMVCAVRIGTIVALFRFAISGQNCVDPTEYVRINFDKEGLEQPSVLACRGRHRVIRKEAQVNVPIETSIVVKFVAQVAAAISRHGDLPLTNEM